MERANPWDEAAAAASALQWWNDAGVDVLVDETPRDWLRPKPKAVPAPSAAPEGDRLPEQLGLFQEWLKASPALPYASPAAPRVCPSGDPAAGLMILTAMPESEDCAAGTLLSGTRGRLFDRMLAAIGRNRGSIYLAALSCLRSPTGGFTEAAASECAKLARHHIGLAAPKALLLFGDAPAKALLGLSMAQARGRWHTIDTPAGPIKALVTLPPDHLLNHPAHKAHAWADLLSLSEELDR